MGNFNDLIYKHLTLDNDGETFNAKEAGSYYIQPDIRRVNVINYLVIVIKGDYGLMANGIKVRIRNSLQPLLDFTEIPIRMTRDWHRYAEGHRSRFVWDFVKAGKPIVLDDNERLEVLVRDDLSHLSEHYFIAGGFEMLPDSPK